MFQCIVNNVLDSLQAVAAGEAEEEAQDANIAVDREGVGYAEGAVSARAGWVFDLASLGEGER